MPTKKRELGVWYFVVFSNNPIFRTVARQRSMQRKEGILRTIQLFTLGKRILCEETLT